MAYGLRDVSVHQIDYGYPITNTWRVASVSPPPVRRYRSAVRQAQARRTRRRVVGAATAVFLDRGYAGATVRAVAAGAGVSVPTVEALFGTKSRLLKAAIDVAIAGDDEPVAVLDRPWADEAGEAGSLGEFLSRAAGALAAAQQRSAGLVVAVFEGSFRDAGLEGLREQMVAQREVTAAWIVQGMTRLAPLRSGLSFEEAVDVVWLLLDPAVFIRLIRHRRWDADRYRRWIADALARLIVSGTPAGQDKHLGRPVRQEAQMNKNRSIPDASVIPVLIYPDVRKAVTWLTDAFGFTERLRIGENHRSQLRFGDSGALIVADVRGDRRPPRPGEVTHSVMVRVEDARAHCEHARAHGARILAEPADFEYGERQYSAEDPFGHQWTFSQTLADVAPRQWGGELAEDTQ